MKPRTRNTIHTQRRIDNMRRLIAALSFNHMEADDIGDFLQFSPSGVRKYIRDMREARIIDIARYIDGTAKYLGRPLYKLTADRAVLDAFMAQLNSEFPAAPRGSTPKPIKEVEEGHRLHIMDHDTNYPVRISRVLAVRDDLVAALFGPAVKA